MDAHIQHQLNTWLQVYWPGHQEKWLQGESIPHTRVAQSFIENFVSDKPHHSLPEYFRQLSHWPFLQLSRKIAKATCEQTEIKYGAIQPLALSTLIQAAVDLGFAQYVFDALLAEVRRRHTFGTALIRNQHVEFTLAEFQANILALEAWWDLANENHDQPGINGSFSQLSTPLLNSLADSYLQFSGGRGYMQGHPAERVFREVFIES